MMAWWSEYIQPARLSVRSGRRSECPANPLIAATGAVTTVLTLNASLLDEIGQQQLLIIFVLRKLESHGLNHLTLANRFRRHDRIL